MLGRFLFRWRGVIGVLAFGLVFWLALPTAGSCLLGLPFLLVGLAVRFWASGYMGIEGRVREIGGRREERGVRREEGGASRSRIVTGPYRILRHPLYIGNFLLVLGMLVALRPALWLVAVVLAGFVVEYTIIVAAEEAELAMVEGKSRAKGQKPKGKAGQGELTRRSQRLEARSESAELRDRIVQNSETRNQNSEFPIAVGDRREAGSESFSCRRAMCEWRTWVVTGVAWGLAFAKAFVMD